MSQRSNGHLRRAASKIFALAAVTIATASQQLGPSGVCLAAPPLKKVDKFEFNLDFNGKGTLITTEQGAVWRVPLQSTAYYCMAPNWDVLIYNEKTKVGKLAPYSQWSQHLNAKDPIKVKSITTIATQYKGKPARTLYLDIEPMDSTKSKGEFFYQSSEGKAKDYSKMEVLELVDKKFPAKLVVFLRWRFGMPFLGGPLIKSTNIYPNGKREITTSLISSTQTTVPLSEWLPPKKYIVVKKSSLINDDANKFKKAAEMFDTLLP